MNVSRLAARFHQNTMAQSQPATLPIDCILKDLNLNQLNLKLKRETNLFFKSGAESLQKRGDAFFCSNPTQRERERERAPNLMASCNINNKKKVTEKVAAQAMSHLC